MGVPLPADQRQHLRSFLMRESLLDRGVQRSTEVPVFRMLPDSYVVKVGGRSVFDRGSEVVHPVVEELSTALDDGYRIIFGTGGGARTRHVFSIGIDLGLPTGVLAQLAAADTLGTAHMLGTLLAPKGVVAIPPEIFGHLLPLFLRAVPGVIYNGLPPYSIWEHPPKVGRIPPHRTDAGCVLLAETFGSREVVLLKDVDGLYTDDPARDPNAELIPEITVGELRQRNLRSLPFDRVILDLLENARLVTRIRIVNALTPWTIRAALAGEKVGTVVHAR